MKITQDVIVDLYPLYLSGEASTDTRAIVEEFLRHDPEFARLVNQQMSETLKAGRPTLPPEHELRTILKTQAIISRRSWLLAIALFLTFIPFSFVFERGHFTFLLCRDAPQVAAICWLAAGWAW